MMNRAFRRTIAFSVRGFSMPIQEACSHFGVMPSKFGEKGDPLKVGTSAVLKRSFIKFEVDVGDEESWDSVLGALFLSFGGVVAVRCALDTMRPEFVEVSVVIPARRSDQQEDRFLNSKTVSDLALLGASFGVGIA